MAERARQKSSSRKAKKGKDIEKSPRTTINIYHTEQYGRHNTCITPMAASDDSSERKKKLIDMVNSIICPPNQTKCSPMYVRDFNDKFKEHFKEDFKTISGVDISKFADKNILMFETSVDKRQNDDSSKSKKDVKKEKT